MFPEAGAVVFIVILFSGVHGGTLLAPPHSPVKVLAAAGIEPVDKLRYYTFSEEEDVKNRERDRGAASPSGSSHPYSSKDPFEIPSLSAIAEMMRRSEKERGRDAGRDSFRERGGYDDDAGGDHNIGNRPEHRFIESDDRRDGGDTGWGWPRPGSRPDDRDRNDDEGGRGGGGGGWSSKGSTWTQPLPRPPPPTSAPGGWGWKTTTPLPPRDGWGWKGGNSEDDDYPSRPSYGKGSYSPVDSKDAFRPWQIESGNDGGGGDNHGWGPPTTEKPRYTPKYLASDEDKYKPIRYPPSITGGGSGWSHSGSETAGNKPVWPSKNNQDGWDSSNNNRPPPPPLDGPGSHYLPPNRDPPLRDPPKWPSNSNDDRGGDNNRNGWGPSTPSPWGENERPPNRGWESSRPRPTAWPSRDDEQTGGGGGSKGWSSWDRNPPIRPHPPPTPGWSSPRDNPRQPGPFEYKAGIDDLTKYLPPIETYEKAEYPPGWSRDRRPYSSKFDNSVEDDSFPRAPNHYRIVAETPSPEEIHKILHQKPTQEPKISKTYLPPKFPSNNNKAQSAGNEGWSQSKPGRNGHNNNSENKRKLEEDKEKWYKENFQKIPLPSININEPEPEGTSPSPKSGKKGDSDSKSNHPDLSPDTSLDGNGKPTVKRTRYDAQGFKYIPYDHPASKKIQSQQPRDIYSRDDGERDSFKRAVIERIKEKSEQQKQAGGLSGAASNKQEVATTRLQGSESRTSFVRRTLTSRSHIPLWKSDDRPSSSSTTQATTITRRTFVTRTTHIPNKPDPEKVEDFGRKINIIRNRTLIKREQGGFKPVSGPFGPGSAKARVVRKSEALVVEPKSETCKTLLCLYAYNKYRFVCDNRVDQRMLLDFD